MIQLTKINECEGEKEMRKILFFIIGMVTIFAITGCVGQRQQDDRVVIFSSDTDDCIKLFQERLDAQFPEYDIVIEYYTTGNNAAKLQAEGKDTECDIVMSLEYGYLDILKDNFADLSNYDSSVFLPEMVDADPKFYPTMRSSGCIIVNKEMLAERGIATPTSYEDLIQPQYKGLISMPNPKSSSTGYMFVKSLVNAWGEDAAFEYFDKLYGNVLQFTSSGSGPVSAVMQEEAAIGMGMTAQAVTEKQHGATYDIIFFDEGAPYTNYGFAMIDGKQQRKCVQDVFEYFHDSLIEENCRKFFPEPIFKNEIFTVEGYPTNIHYADMSNDTSIEKKRLLEKWSH